MQVNVKMYISCIFKIACQIYFVIFDIENDEKIVVRTTISTKPQR